MIILDKLEPSYWAVLPAAIRYDAAIPAGAKILYAEISSLTDQRGYCFASNAYFCGLYAISEPTLQRYLRALKSGGYIQIEDGDGGAGRRKIYAGVNPLAVNPVKNDGVAENPVKNDGETPSKMTPNPLKNDRTNRNNKKENKKENKTPLPPKEAKAPMPEALMKRVEVYAQGDTELLAALLDFARQRSARKKPKPITTERQLTLLLSRLNELSRGSRAAKLALIEKATINDWLSFYPLDGDDQRGAAAAAGGRRVDAPEVAQW